MLTLEEARCSFKAFKIFCILNILPLEVDAKSGKIQRQSSRVKYFMWEILFGVAISHLFYGFGRLVQSTVVEPEKYFRWDHFVLHFGLTFGYTAFFFTGFCLFVKTPEEIVILFNQLFQQREDPVQKIIDQGKEVKVKTESSGENGIGGNETSRIKSATLQVCTSSTSGSNEQVQNQSEAFENQPRIILRPRPLWTWPPQYSLDELVAKLVPLVAMPTVVLTILVLAVDPSRPQLLYSSLPPEFKSFWSFLILLPVEMAPSAIVVFTGCFSNVTQVLFFSKCQLEIKRMSLQLRNLQEKLQNSSLETGSPTGGREIEREIWILRQISMEMRELVLLIELFNRCFPFCIFFWKICSLSVAVLFYFFVIRHSQDFPVFAGFSGYAAIVVTLIYTIMYEQAFSIPGKIEDLKNEFLLTAQKTTRILNSNGNGNLSKVLWAEMKREIKRIHSVGIQVGSFHRMERQSTPNYVNFVLQQVVSLLVTFPQ